MSNYQFVTALHGNERLPVLALASAGVPQVVANPLALARNKRFIEKDMNASFGTGGATYEERQAREVLAQLNRNLPVIDFHSFSAESESFAIIVDLKLLPLARLTGLRHIVFMRYNDKQGHALINHVDGVSVEVGTHDDSTGFDLTLELVGQLEAGGEIEADQKLYEVYDIIEKPGDYVNFSLHAEGFYPVLAGENAYNHYGLKARLLEDL